MVYPMPFSDAQLISRLEDLSFQFETRDDYVTSKVLLESAARILQLSGINMNLNARKQLTWSTEMESTVEFLIKNPWTGEIENGF
jgi:hypothetical protein